MNNIYENENCPVCYYEYEIFNEDKDDYDKVESCMPICGHKLCMECRDEIVFCGNSCCPICRTEWENDFKNDDDDDDNESFNSDVFDFREGDIEEEGYISDNGSDDDSDDEIIKNHHIFISNVKLINDFLNSHLI